MKILFSYVFEENTITNYLRTYIARQAFGSLEKFSHCGEGTLTIFLGTYLNVLNAGDKWFEFHNFQKSWWHRKHIFRKFIFSQWTFLGLRDKCSLTGLLLRMKQGRDSDGFVCSAQPLKW